MKLPVLAALSSTMALVEGIRWCATSPEELAKCKEMLPIFTQVNATNPWTCVQEADSDACVEAVGLGTADVMVVGARDIVLAAERFGTQLVLAEARGVGAEAKPSKSYALAVVHKDTDMSQGWESLRGKRSCHTGYRKNAGWQMPVGSLVYSGVLTLTDNDPEVPDDLEAVMAFFSGGSCIPSREDVIKDGINAVCGQCKGDCSWTAGEPFQDHEGAFLCLKERAGDVAFNIQGNVPVEEWDDYRLVCIDGTTAPMAQFQTCNMAGVPGGHIITGGDKTAEQVVSIKADIQAAAATPAFAAMFFNTAAGPTNKDSLLFSDNTGAFAEVAPSTIYTLGNAYDAYATIGRIDDGTLPVLVQARRRYSGRVHKRFREATIALAVLFVLAIIGTVLLFLRMRKSNRRLSKELSKSQGHTQDWNTTGGKSAVLA